MRPAGPLKHMEKAKTLLFSGDIDEGIERLRSLPESPDKSYWLGRAIHRVWMMTGQGDLREAHLHMAAALLSGREESEAWAYYGRLLSDVGDLAGAALAQQRALQLEPANIFAMQNLAVLFQMFGLPGTEEAYRSLLDNVTREQFELERVRHWWLTDWDEFRNYVHANLADLLFGKAVSLPEGSPDWLGVLNEAIEHCEQALEYDPDDAPMEMLKANAEALLSQAPDALASG